MKKELSAASLALICLAGAAWAFSFGVLTQLSSLWLQYKLTSPAWGVSEDSAKLIIGFNHAAHYLGLFLAALLFHNLMLRWGLRSALVAMICCGVTLILFPAGGPIGWFSWRLLNGM